MFFVRHVEGDTEPEWASEVPECKSLVLKYLSANDSVSFQEIYSDASEPGDLPLYQAVRELLAEGTIIGPSIDEGLTHTDLVYRHA